jgi:hypothetical protein
MTTYDSVYIYMSILLFEPLLVPFIKFWYRKVKKYDNVEKVMNKLLPSTLKPIESSLNNSVEVVEEEEVKENIVMKYYKMSKKNKVKYVLFNQTQFIVDIVIFMTLSVTIGFMLPLVGIIMCISLYLYIHSILSNVGGKLTNATMNEKEILEKECGNIADNFKTNLNSNIYLIMVLFFSLLVFDTVGDKSGSNVAIWFSILTLFIPLILWLIKRLYLLYYYNKQYVESNEFQEGISLQNIKNSEVNNPLNNDN